MAAGLHVVGTWRTEGGAGAVAAAGGVPLHLDVADESSVRDAAAEVARLFGGRLDVLVNNAGVAFKVRH